MAEPRGDDDDAADHHPEQSFAVLFVRRPENRVRRRNRRTLQDSGLVVEPEAELDAQVAAQDNGRVSPEKVPVGAIMIFARAL